MQGKRINRRRSLFMHTHQRISQGSRFETRWTFSTASPPSGMAGKELDFSDYFC